jgi:hypothetical protein
MLLRAWLEGGEPTGLRVRVFSTIGTNEATPLAVTSTEAVLAVVRSWLEELGAGPTTFS